jgi:N-acetylglucosaminyl-diphospho-decaprenol L-rhamnosyltransferase
VTACPGVAGSVAGVVVNYNAKDYLVGCVGSLLEEGLSAVVVADNGSTDGSQRALAELFPTAQWVPTGANLGYGSAVDIGASMVTTEYLLVCNADVVVTRGAVATLCRFLDDRSEVAVVGPLIVDAHGELYPSARRFPDIMDAFGHGLMGQFWAGNPFSRRYRMTDWDHACTRDVDWVSGACFLVRRKAWDAVGGFDRAYFMYMEDVDLCWRLSQSGWVIAYEPAARVMHVQGVSADRHPYRMLLAHHVSMWRFARQTTTGAGRLALPIVLTGLTVRLGVTVCRRAWSGWRSPGPSLRRRTPRRAEG